MDEDKELDKEQVEQLEEMRGISYYDDLYRLTDDLPFPGQPPFPIKPTKKRWTLFRKKEVKRKPI